MLISVLLFAGLKDAAQTSRIELEVPPNSLVGEALEQLETEHPSLGRWLPISRLALNMEYTDRQQMLHEGDEVALIPPVAGGSDDISSYVLVVEREVGLDEVVAAVRREGGTAIGAICTFLGVVRDHSTDLEGQQHDDIEFLDYEVYHPMARRELEKITDEAREKWDVKIAVCHRVGRIEKGEASVAIASASAHRAPAFEACRFVIEELKTRVPIWKKETARSGVWWSEGQKQALKATSASESAL